MVTTKKKYLLTRTPTGQFWTYIPLSHKGPNNVYRRRKERALRPGKSTLI